MRVDRIVLRKMKMTLKTPFETSFGVMRDKHFILASVHAGEHTGYGDCPAFDTPWYNEETTATAWHMLRDFLIPALFSRDRIEHPEELQPLFAQIRRNNMAKSALDCAMWDLYAKRRGMPLSKALGGTRARVEFGHQHRHPAQPGRAGPHRRALHGRGLPPRQSEDQARPRPAIPQGHP